MSGSDYHVYIGKRVRLIIEDKPFPKPKDGVVTNCNDTHIFLKLDNSTIPKPFLLSTIRRIDTKENEEQDDTTKN